MTDHTVKGILREAHGRDNRTGNTVRGILREGHILILKVFESILY